MAQSECAGSFKVKHHDLIESGGVVIRSALHFINASSETIVDQLPEDFIENGLCLLFLFARDNLVDMVKRVAHPPIPASLVLRSDAALITLLVGYELILHCV